MPYEPKYKIGESVEANGEGMGNGSLKGDVVVILGTYRIIDDLRPYPQKVDYDQSDAEHTLYGTYSPARDKTRWYFEDEILPYCSNTERGKNLIRDYMLDFIVDYDIAFYNREKFRDLFKICKKD